MQIPCVYIPGPAPAVSVANKPAVWDSCLFYMAFCNDLYCSLCYYLKEKHYTIVTFYWEIVLFTLTCVFEVNMTLKPRFCLDSETFSLSEAKHFYWDSLFIQLTK